MSLFISEDGNREIERVRVQLHKDSSNDEPLRRIENYRTIENIYVLCVRSGERSSVLENLERLTVHCKNRVIFLRGTVLKGFVSRHDVAQNQ